MNELQEKIRNRFGYHACEHSFTYYKNDEVACKELEIIGQWYVELSCQDCEAFKVKDISFWADIYGLDDFTDEEIAEIEKLRERKDE